MLNQEQNKINNNRNNLKIIPFLEADKLKGYSNEKENNLEMKFKNITIRKREDKNIWYCRIRINGKQKYICSKNQEECLKKLKLAVKERNKEVKQENITYTLQTWFDTWLDKYKRKSNKNIKETTIKDYLKAVKYFNKYKNINIKNITTLNLIDLLNNIPYERTKQRIYETLRQLFNKALINNIISKNPMLDIEKPICKKTEKIILNEKEEILFIKECENTPYGDFFLICLYQGLRRGECLAITKQDIDYENKILNIDKSINSGTKETNTKNEYSTRKIPIFKNTLKILEKYKNLKNNERLFNLQPQNIDKHFKKLTNKLELKITIHSLRHNFITKLVEQGIAENIIQKIVGHSKNSSITKRVYTHTRDEAFNKAIETINNNID